MNIESKGHVCAIAVIASIITLASCAGGGHDATKEATILLEAGYAGSWPAGLDPATNTTARANLSMMNAIFGGLFQLAASQDDGEARITGVLAEGYELADGGRTLVIRLREGAVFSDGTPFDAEAVRYNIERNLNSPCTCSPRDWPWVADGRVTIVDQYTLRLHFERPFSAAINAFPVSNLNWIASPAALDRLGVEQFRRTPIGAGPFRIVHNVLSSRLELERNPLYFASGRPFLDRLVFQSIGSEQAAYQALIAGDAAAYEGMTSPTIIELAQRNVKLRVTLEPPTSPYVVQLNTIRAPFDDVRVREAVYYATDVDAIRKGLFKDWYPASQSFTGPGGLFHVAQIPGYRTYDLNRAREIVSELGGVHITLATLHTPVAEQVLIALQTQWQAAGIRVEIELYELPVMIRAFQSKEWQAILSVVGSYDPEAGTGVGLRFRSDGTYSGVRDTELDTLLLEAAGASDKEQRQSLYFAAGKHISDRAYAPFLFAFAPAQVTARDIEGPGLTTRIPPILLNTGILWADVAVSR